jgi:putative (di)nucleoside polyphosphate hydrolase
MDGNKQEKPYRRNVAAFVLNEEGKILTCRRSDNPNNWQLPQGGVKEAEALDAAMLRELKEEIGTSEVDVLYMLDQPIRYAWPVHLHQRGYQGQEQHYFLVRLREAAAINLHADDNAEFDYAEWLSANQFLNRLDGFKAAAYTQALRQLMQLFPGTIFEDQSGFHK